MRGSLICYLLILLGLVSCNTTHAKIYADASTSNVSFAGEHAGMNFEGQFKKWHATLDLPPAERPSIVAEFDLSSATTGDFTYDTTLPEGDWFDVKNFPTGSFVSSDIQTSDNQFYVTGTLTLKGIKQQQSFVLIDSGDHYTAEFLIDRLLFDIGKESDPDAQWVSRDILMRMHIAKP